MQSDDPRSMRALEISERIEQLARKPGGEQNLGRLCQAEWMKIARLSFNRTLGFA
jgi:hypothetical protein